MSHSEQDYIGHGRAKMSRIYESLLVFAVSVSLLTTTAFAQMLPDRWNSDVPEGAMGQSFAIYFQNSPERFGMVFHCLGRDEALLATVSSVVSADYPDQGDMNPRYLIINGQNFRLPPEDEQSYLSLVWDGQHAMLAALNAGGEVVAVLAPGGNIKEAVEIGRIVGEPNPVGLEHTIADCGGGVAVDGPVETIQPDQEDDRVAGEWYLLPRSEHIDAPVAKNIGPSGESINLVCLNNAPALAVFGVYGIPDSDMIPVTKFLSIDDMEFSVSATFHSVGSYLTFPLPRSLMGSLSEGEVLRFPNESAIDVEITLRGFDAALDHALLGCGPAG